MEKNNPFKIPDNYFQEFKLEIMDKLPENKLKSKKLFFKNTLMKWSSVAAVALIITFIGLQYIDNHNKQLATESHLTEDKKMAFSAYQQPVSLENDYYLFLEDEATMSMYRDVINSDDF